MAIALSSLGVQVFYQVAPENVIPTGLTLSALKNYEIPEVKSIPSLSPAPDTLETTPLSNQEYKTYINGLKDLGGALEFTANLTQQLLNIWNGTSSSDTNSVMYKFEHMNDGKKDGDTLDALWLIIRHPRLDNSVYFTFQPAKIGLPEMAVNSVLEATISITPTGEVQWGDKVVDDTNT